ncbi:MAG: hypothetical protein ACP5IJ_02420, partial [Candidatus Nanoarchaeia archaeon]
MAEQKENEFKKTAEPSKALSDYLKEIYLEGSTTLNTTLNCVSEQEAKGSGLSNILRKISKEMQDVNSLLEAYLAQYGNSDNVKNGK